MLYNLSLTSCVHASAEMTKITKMVGKQICDMVDSNYVLTPSFWNSYFEIIQNWSDATLKIKKKITAIILIGFQIINPFPNSISITSNNFRWDFEKFLGSKFVFENSNIEQIPSHQSTQIQILNDLTKFMVHF